MRLKARCSYYTVTLRRGNRFHHRADDLKVLSPERGRQRKGHGVCLWTPSSSQIDRRTEGRSKTRRAAGRVEGTRIRVRRGIQVLDE